MTRLIEQLHENPLRQLEIWIDEAAKAGVNEPNAMSLATSTRSGSPSLRIVLAKGIVDGAVHFFTNYESRKARELAENPVAAACFHWVHAARQVRLEGSIEKVPRHVSEAYFATRPRGSQIAAWASHQSQSLAHYDDLLAAERLMREKYGETGIVPCPPHWGGYALTPTRCEFWLGLPSRMHDRVLFERQGAGWRKQQISP